MPVNTNPEDDLFEAALLKSPGPERTAFLDGECQSDPDLRARVEMMLEGHFNAKDFLENLPTEIPPERTIALPKTVVMEQLGSQIGHYKLLQKLGEGGCGLVYLAEQSQPVRRRVALKVIKLGMDTRSVIARFEAERQALALMDHPNIAKVFDAGATETGRPYFVMELVRGTRISDYCDQNNLPTGQRLSLFIQVCQAIQHAHQKGIIHRDIKPSNILVTLHDGEPVPKVIDFGIAKATCEQRLTDKTIFTAFEQFIGTPAYMSPEQAEMSGLDIDTRSDIYSLGVLLYELLTGSTPFDAKELLASGLDAMRKTIREKEPVRPSTRFATLQDDALATTAQRRSAEPSKLLHQLKGDLDWIIMKCLEKDRARRYETANGLAMGSLPGTRRRLGRAATWPWVGWMDKWTCGLAVSPDGGLVAAGTSSGQVRLFDSAKGELIEPPLHGHLNGVAGVAFSQDGRRLISTSGGREAVKLWDLGTRQELLTLSGSGSSSTARWSADGNVILAGPPWQAWRAPSWEEIAAAEKGTEWKRP